MSAYGVEKGTIEFVG